MAEAEAELQAGDEASAPAAEAHTVQFDENPTTVKADENEDDDVPEAEELAQFWEAVREGDQEIIDELLVGDEEHPPIGVKVNEQDESGKTPLHWLTIEGHASTAQWLIDEVGADVNESDSTTGMTPLHYAAEKGTATCAALLLQRGADPVRRDLAGWTPLHAAARSGFTEVAETLLEALTPKQYSLQGPMGQAALHRAAYWGQLEVAALMVERGADKYQLDEAKCRPYDIVCDGGEHFALMPELLHLLSPPRPEVKKYKKI